MDKKAKKRLEVIKKKLAQLQQQLAGATRQMDDPDEVRLLRQQIEQLQAEATALKQD